MKTIELIGIDFFSGHYSRWHEWSRYASGGVGLNKLKTTLSSPCICLTRIADVVLSVGLKSIVYVGCGNCRNVVPFVERSISVVCCDLFPPAAVSFHESILESDFVSYAQCSVKDITVLAEQAFDGSFSDSAVITQATLMYVSELEQREFVKTIRALGCRAVALHEYTSDDFLTKRGRPFGEGGTCFWLDRDGDWLAIECCDPQPSAEMAPKTLVRIGHDGDLKFAGALIK